MFQFRVPRRLALFAAIGLVAIGVGCARTPPAPTAGGAATPGSPQDFSTNVGDRVYFAVDSSQISPQAAGILDRQAEWLNQYPRYAVTVEGHADERGTREYNIALSARRADATKNYLQSRGVSTGRLNTISFGKERPVAVCDSESCWSQNRRSVTLLQGS